MHHSQLMLFPAPTAGLCRSHLFAGRLERREKWFWIIFHVTFGISEYYGVVLKHSQFLSNPTRDCMHKNVLICFYRLTLYILWSPQLVTALFWALGHTTDFPKLIVQSAECFEKQFLNRYSTLSKKSKWLGKHMSRYLQQLDFKKF